MSYSFADDVDNVAFSVQTPDQAETAQFSSTGRDTFIRLYTNNNQSNENFASGFAIGSSNYDLATGSNEFYIGPITATSNIHRVLRIRENTLGIGTTASPTAALTLQATPGIPTTLRVLPASDVGGTATPAAPAIHVASSGEVGIGAEATPGVALTVGGQILFDQVQFRPGSNLDMNGGGISNVQLLSATEIRIDRCRGLSAPVIDFGSNTLSNVGELQVARIAPAPASDSAIHFATGTALSNLAAVYTDAIYINTLSTTSNVLAFSHKTLDDIALLTAGELRTHVLRAPGPGTAIDFSQNDLSNIREVSADYFSSPNGHVHFADNSICNINEVRAHAIYIDRIYASNAAACNVIHFAGADVDGIHTLRITGNMYAGGDFFVSDTITTITDQLSVENDGTGPALIVNQIGAAAVAKFQHDSNTIFYIADGGYVGVGSFGVGVGTDYPGMFLLKTNGAIDRTAFYIDHGSATAAAVRMDFAATGRSDQLPLVIDGAGRVGLGTSGSPAARLSVVQPSATYGDLVRIRSGTGATAPALVVGSNNAVGIGGEPDDARSLTVVGTTRVDILETARITASGPDPAVLDFASNSLSNIESLVLAGGARIISGSGSDFVIETPLGTERLRILGANGRVGVGTAAPATSFHIATTDSLRLPRGTTAERPSPAGAGDVRYNTDLQTFEGYGPGATWGTLGGVKSADGYTTITAEATPGANDSNIRVFTSGVERIRVDPAGRLGVGTTAPAVLADIAGTARAVVLQVATLQRNPAAAGAFIDFNGETLSNIAEIRVARIAAAAPAQAIDVSAATLSNVGQIEATRVVAATIAPPPASAGTLDLSAAILSNVAQLRTASLSGETGYIHFASNHLSNIASLATPILYTSELAPLFPATQIEIRSGTSLNVEQVNVARIRGSGGSGGIDLTATVFSNLQRLEVARVAPAAPGTPLDFAAATLSNVGALRVAQLTGPTALPGATIDIAQTSLSNVATLHAAEAVVGILRPAPGTPAIDVAASTLSNVGTLETTVIRGPGGLSASTIDAAQSALSNLSSIETPRFAAPPGVSAIDASGLGLSNLGTLAAATVSTPILTAPGAGIDFSGKAAVGISFLTTSSINSDTVSIQFNNRSLSNINALESHSLATDTLGPHLTNGVNCSYTTLSNIGVVATDRLTTNGSPALDCSQKTLSNVAAIRVPVVSSPTGVVDFAAGSLSNVAALVVDVLQAPDGVLDFAAGTLSNAETLSVLNLTSPTGAINLQSVLLSNVSALNSELLYVSTVATNAPAQRVDFSGISLSNINTIYTQTLTHPSGVVEIAAATRLSTTSIYSPTATLNLGGNRLSNVGVLEVQRVGNPAAAIDFSSNILSNVAALRVGRMIPAGGDAWLGFSDADLREIASLSTLRLESPTGVLDASSNTLSNIPRIYAAALSHTTPGQPLAVADPLQVAEIRAASIWNPATTRVEFAGGTLSNIAAVETDRLQGPQGILDFAQNHASNLATLTTTALRANRIAPASTATPIDFEAATLSNIAIASVQRLTAPADVLDCAALSLSNVALVQTTGLRSVGGAPGTPGISGINLYQDILSNVYQIEVPNITTAAAGIPVYFTNRALTGVASLTTATITSPTGTLTLPPTVQGISSLSTAAITSPANVLDASGLTLSNVAAVEVATLTAPAATINCSQKVLSNVAELAAATVRTATFAPANGAFDFSGADLSNVGNTTINANREFRTNRIRPADGSNITFQGYNVSGIHDLTISGAFSVQGEFNITDTTTSNSTQMTITNYGQGPALIVDQLGAESIVHFLDDSNVVFHVEDGGGVAIGRFGIGAAATAAIAALPIANVYIQNATTALSGAGLIVEQTQAANDIVRFTRGTTAAENRLVLANSGRMSLGAPAAAAPAVVLDLSGATDAVRLPAGTAGQRPGGPAVGDIRYNTTTQVYEGYYGAGGWGSVGGVWSENLETYITAETTRGANDGILRFTTNLGERMRITPTGEVGIGTTAPGAALEVAGGIRAQSLRASTLSSASGIIHCSQSDLSNVAVLRVATIAASGAAAPAIDFTQSDLSNVAVLRVATIAASGAAAAPAIDFAQSDLSNVRSIAASNVDAAVLYASSAIRLPDGSNLMTVLSNLTVLAGSGGGGSAFTGETITVSTITSASNEINISAKGLSNVATLSAATVSTPSLTTTEAVITANRALNITGYSATLYSANTSLATLGETADKTRIGLKITYNAQAESFLSTSDARAKCAVSPDPYAAATPAADLRAVVELPVRTYAFRSADGEPRATRGFFAQEVEAVAPYAVRTVCEAIPSIMRYGVLQSNRTQIYAESAAAAAATFDPALEGKTLRILDTFGGSFAAKVERVKPLQGILILSAPIETSGRVLIYGEYVDDFKLLDHDRLLPMVFNAVKGLHDRVAGIEDRLCQLETFLIPR